MYHWLIHCVSPGAVHKASHSVVTERREVMDVALDTSRELKRQDFGETAATLLVTPQSQPMGPSSTIQQVIEFP